MRCTIHNHVVVVQRAFLHPGLDPVDLPQHLGGDDVAGGAAGVHAAVGDDEELVSRLSFSCSLARSKCSVVNIPSM
ncbi:hypothetical protein BA011_08970 [Rhizobium leguminosarum]|uniref:Uncharacterized protein n=1 Tax=Rhizobium leguminosarum TaxID=384 RepID=A0A1B1C7T6_RHILE|nr:hypothetical protein BA011_08970 [Rhizobium leguminosarum]